MEEKKLVCPYKRIDATSMDLKVDLHEDKMNIKVDLTTKNIVNTLVDFINKKFGGKKDE